jgi:hypothetical protein
MKYLRRAAPVAACVLASFIVGCGGTDRPAGDGGGADSGGSDAGRLDGAVADAGGSDAGGDAGGDDAGSPDASAGDAGTCFDGLSEPCETIDDCTSGFECNIGRCMPQGREVCGGFAGAPCTMSPYTECLYFTSADFGTCLTPAELACACARSDASTYFVCPEA